jgi:hypothetical protein
MAPLSLKKKKLESVVVQVLPQSCSLHFTSPHLTVAQELTALYEKKLLPIEKKFLFHKFHASELLPSELNAKPQVLLLGQYSTGKVCRSILIVFLLLTDLSVSLSLSLSLSLDKFYS